MIGFAAPINLTTKITYLEGFVKVLRATKKGSCLRCWYILSDHSLIVPQKEVPRSHSVSEVPSREVLDVLLCVALGLVAVDCVELRTTEIS